MLGGIIITGTLTCPVQNDFQHTWAPLQFWDARLLGQFHASLSFGASAKMRNQANTLDFTVDDGIPFICPHACSLPPPIPSEPKLGFLEPAYMTVITSFIPSPFFDWSDFASLVQKISDTLLISDPKISLGKFSGTHHQFFWNIHDNFVEHQSAAYANLTFNTAIYPRISVTTCPKFIIGRKNHDCPRKNLHLTCTPNVTVLFWIRKKQVVSLDLTMIPGCTNTLQMQDNAFFIGDAYERICI